MIACAPYVGDDLAPALADLGDRLVPGDALELAAVGPSPWGPTRRSGYMSRSGLAWWSWKSFSFTHRAPRVIGWSLLPLTSTSFPSSHLVDHRARVGTVVRTSARRLRDLTCSFMQFPSLGSASCRALIVDAFLGTLAPFARGVESKSLDCASLDLAVRKRTVCVSSGLGKLFGLTERRKPRSSLRRRAAAPAHPRTTVFSRVDFECATFQRNLAVRAGKVEHVRRQRQP